jgi:hypothetical protein
MLCVHLRVLRAHEVVLRKKMNFYMAYVKIINLGTPSNH